MKGHRLQFVGYSFILFLVLSTVACNLYPAYAQADSLGEARINAASPLYFLKSAREILELKFAGTPYIKAYRYLEFANRRIRETKSLAKSSRQDLIQPTLIMYLTHLQELSGTWDLKDSVVVSQIIETTASQSQALQTLSSQASDSQASRSIRLAIFRLSEWDGQLVNKLTELKKTSLAEQVLSSQLSACRFLAKEASSSALSEVEKVVYLQRAQKCFDKMN